ncbi:L-histidine N(alpha)-methyltransferase [Bradyrhizobium japonicum]
MEGLSLAPKAIPARWLYDRRGSALFEAITLLPEYYPTRTERSILASAVSEIAALAGPGRAVIEFGSGSSAKTRLLLAETEPSAYVPIDISASSSGRLRQACRMHSRAADLSNRGRFHLSLCAAGRDCLNCSPRLLPGRRSET